MEESVRHDRQCSTLHSPWRLGSSADKRVFQTNGDTYISREHVEGGVTHVELVARDERQRLVASAGTNSLFSVVCRSYRVVWLSRNAFCCTQEEDNAIHLMLSIQEGFDDFACLFWLLVETDDAADSSRDWICFYTPSRRTKNLNLLRVSGDLRADWPETYFRSNR